MMSALRDVLVAITKMEREDLRLVSIMSHSLFLQTGDLSAYGLDPVVKVNPNLIDDEAVKNLKPGVTMYYHHPDSPKGKELKAKAKGKTAKAKKAPVKEMDAAKILANRSGPKAKGNTNASAPDVHRGLIGRVVEALKQTTGKVTSRELAEILEVHPPQKVSECLVGSRPEASKASSANRVRPRWTAARRCPRSFTGWRPNE